MYLLIHIQTNTPLYCECISWTIHDTVPKTHPKPFGEYPFEQFVITEGFGSLIYGEMEQVASSKWYCNSPNKQSIKSICRVLRKKRHALSSVPKGISRTEQKILDTKAEKLQGDIGVLRSMLRECMIKIKV